MSFKGLKHSDETKKNMSYNRSGSKSYWYGKKRSEETKRKIGDKHRGKSSGMKDKKQSECAKKKIGNANKNRIHSKEQNRKHSEIMKGRTSPMKGKKHTIESNNKNAQSHKGKLPSYLSSWGKGSYYDSPLQGKVWLRSSYELAYVEWLDSQKILWYYEIETFDLGDTTYTPDFFLPQFEKFIEIKGYMKKESQIKINKFLEQYPWDLDILFKKDLIKLGIEL